MSTKKLVDYYQYKQQQKNFAESKLKFFKIKELINKVKNKFYNYEDHLSEINNVDGEDFNLSLIQEEVEKYDDQSDKMEAFGIKNINLNPNYQIEIRLGDQQIALNASFLNYYEKDRLKISITPKYSEFYNCVSTFYNTEKKCYEIIYEEMDSNRDDDEQIKGIQIAKSYYLSQNHQEGQNMAFIFEELSKRIREPIINVFQTQPKTMIKSISDETKSWIYTQKWSKRVYEFSKESGYERFLSIMFSKSLLEYYGFNDQVEMSEKKRDKILADFSNSFKVTNYLSFVRARYTNDERLNKKIKKLGIEYPEKIYSEGIYLEKLDGDTDKVNVWIWYEKFTENMKGYIMKYSVFIDYK